MKNALNIKRQTNALQANRILNDPAVKPWIAGDFTGYIDLQPVIDNQDNVILGHENGVAFFHKLQPGIYEMHISVMPQARGQWVVDASAVCFRYMFTHTDALEIITRCPINNPRAKEAAVTAGMSYEFTTGAIWPTPKGDRVAMDVYTLSIQQWAVYAETLIEESEWLHTRYEEEFKRLGVSLPAHPSDNVHNLYAGAAVAMARAGQVRKAVGFYNRWAALAGYSQAEVTSLEPIEITVDGVTMRLNKTDFEIVKCPQ